MYDITFLTHGGSTYTTARTWEAAVKEAARILADQTDQCWTWHADKLGSYTGTKYTTWELLGEGRVNGTIEPIPWRITIVGETA